MGQLDAAAASYREALRLNPGSSDALVNLGNVCAGRQQWDEAVGHFRQALGLQPEHANALKNLAVTLLDQGQSAEAEQVFRQMLDVHPDSPEAHLGLASCYLLRGDFERGWPEYEWRWRTPEFGSLPNLSRWEGQPLAGRSLLLLAEQGLGDTIQFIRYARPLKQRGARVVLACPPALARLLARSPDLDELFVRGPAEDLPRCDYYLPLLSAPGALGTGASTIPCTVPYLSADPELAAHWRRELAGIEGLKIGIAWQGSREFRQDRWRSIPLARFSPLAELPGVRLVSLQKGFGSEQLAEVDFPVLDLGDRLDEAAGPLMDTAAIMSNLDLIVTSDTAIAHLAGALAVPVWVALPRSPNWRWLLERDDSPWYPTMRLYRQTVLGDWEQVFRRIAAELPVRERAEPSG